MAWVLHMQQDQVHILGCQDHSTGQSVDRNSNLKTHRIGTWRCRGQLQLKKQNKTLK